MSWTGSEFEVKKIGFKFADAEAYQTVECIGSMEEDMAVKTVTKKCRGVVRKKRTRGTGEGTVKLTVHIPYAIYVEAFGMKLDSLKDGVYAYGENSVHKNFAMVADVEDEDGNEKLKAYPNATMNTGVVRKIENGAEEVAELELEVGVMPDKFGNGLYETLVEEGDEETANEWMTAFDPEDHQVTSA